MMAKRIFFTWLLLLLANAACSNGFDLSWMDQTMIVIYFVINLIIFLAATMMVVANSSK